MRLKKTFNVVVLSVFSFGKYRILTYTERYQRSFEVARATYKYILKNCHQHSYGFQNFMSSWGSWSKISKLQQVGDVSFFRSKSSLFIFTTTWESFFCECKENGANEPVYLQCPFGVQRLSIYTTRPEGPNLRMGWMDGWNIKSILQISLYFVGI